MKILWQLCLSACFFLHAEEAVLRNSCGMYLLPVEGVIHRKEGTVEITMEPHGDMDGIRNSWPFVFGVPGKINSAASRTVLGLYRTPGLPAHDGFSSVARTNNGKRSGFADPSTGIKQGKKVNLALSWGKKGLCCFINGKLKKKDVFSGELQKTAPFFHVGVQSPFYVSALKISSRQLKEDELEGNPERPFRNSPDCTMTVQIPGKPVFHATTPFQDKISVLPFDLLAGRIFDEGEPWILSFAAFNGTGKKTSVPLRLTIVRDDGKKEILHREIELAGDEVYRKIQLEVPVFTPGLYSVEAKTERGESHEFRVSVLPSIKGKTGKLAEYLGASHNFQPEVFRKLNLRWVRFWGAPVLNWYQVEPERGKFDFRTADETVEDYRRNGVKMLAVLGYPPLWGAAPPPRGKEFAKYKFTEMPGRWKPADRKEWTAYVSETARHFNNRIFHYEIYNEVDFKPPAMAVSFSGTTREYFELLRTASDVLRKQNPDNKVLISGFSMIPGPCDVKMPGELLETGAEKYTDIWNLHAYRALVNVPEMKKMVHKKRPGMPFWQTEQMWHILKDPARVEYMTAAINFWFLQEGFERFMTFGWNEFLSDGHTMSPQNALHAFGVCQRFFAVAERYLGVEAKLPADEFDVRHRLLMTDGRFLCAVGSSTASYQLRIANPDAEVFGLNGRKKDLHKGVLVTGKEIHFILTGKPLEISGFELLSENKILYNTSFENLTGDTMAGLESCTPEGWIFRTAHDKAGKISVSSGKAADGKISMRLATSGKRVYLFQYVKPKKQGRYQITAHFRNLSGNAHPYLSVYDTEQKSNFLIRKNFKTPSGEACNRYSFEFDLNEKQAKHTLAVIFGIDEQPGEILLDKVDMRRLGIGLFPAQNAVIVPLEKFIKDSEKSQECAFRSLEGEHFFGGVPYRLGKRAGTVSGNILELAIPVPRGYYQAAWLASCLMYAPKHKELAATLVWRYQDGSESEMPIRSGMETADWYVGPNSETPKIKVAEIIMPDLSTRNLYAGSLRNPNPESMVTGLVIRSAGGKSNLILPALTLQKTERGSK